MVAKKRKKKEEKIKEKRKKIYKKVSEKTIVSSDATLEVGGMYDMLSLRCDGTDSWYSIIISRKHPP